MGGDWGTSCETPTNTCRSTILQKENQIIVGMEEEGKEEGTRYPRKELIFSSLPYAHALTLQARGKVCEGCLSPADPFTECSNCLANHCSTECRSGDLMHTLSCPHPRLSLLPGQSQLVGRVLLR